MEVNNVVPLPLPSTAPPPVAEVAKEEKSKNLESRWSARLAVPFSPVPRYWSSAGFAMANGWPSPSTVELQIPPQCQAISLRSLGELGCGF